MLKFPSRHCFWCILQILMDCVLIFSSQYSLISLEISSLAHLLFKNALFNLPVFGIFQLLFSYWYLVPLGLKADMIFILLNLLYCILWPIIWSVLVNAPWKLEKNMHPAIVRWNSLWMLIMSNWWWMVSMSSTLSILIFCLVDLSVTYRDIELQSSLWYYQFLPHVFWHHC